MATEQTFVLPDLGEGLTEAEIVAWHVAEGDHVVADQPLVSVETDKAVVEIPSPWSGRIAHLLAGIHTRIAVGAPLAVFGETAGADTGTVVGSLAPGIAPLTGVTETAGAAVAVSLPNSASDAAPLGRDGGVPKARSPRPGVRPRAAPAVRALAASHRVDLASLAGSGPDGEITRADVERAVAGQETGGAAPLSGVRRAMAVRMAEAGAAVVPATLTEEADVTAWPKETPITARLVLALAAGCAAEPALNVFFDGRTMTRRLNAAVHVGLAMDTRDGLFVPVLHDANTADAETISARLETLLEAVTTRTIAPDAMRGATITLSNFGMLGGLFASLVVVPPQVAILGAGRIHAGVVPDGDGFRARRVLPLSLTFDHRAATGGEAARFLAAVIAHLATAS